MPENQSMIEHSNKDSIMNRIQGKTGVNLQRILKLIRNFGVNMKKPFGMITN